MIRINLLPVNKRPSLLPAGANILLLLSLTAFFLNAALAAFNYYQILGLEERLEQVERQNALLRLDAVKMAADRNKERQIDAKVDLLLKITGERFSLSALLAHLGNIMPQEVWLSETSVKKGDRRENNTVTLKGQTANYDAIAAFMQKIEQDGYFTNPVLVKAEKAGQHNQFEITATLLPK
ncbi:MAG: PilN domain-containing protein [Sporomusaceae bacterium]|jgi:Tfp pilus assembly protein PilN|nr:PilN domain-containing protein [Sporomusaceae bacterium]